MLNQNTLQEKSHLNIKHVCAFLGNSNFRKYAKILQKPEICV